MDCTGLGWPPVVSWTVIAECHNIFSEATCRLSKMPITAFRIFYGPQVLENMLLELILTMLPDTNVVTNFSVNQMILSLNLHKSKCWENTYLILFRFLELNLHQICLKNGICASVMNYTSKPLLLYFNGNDWTYEGFWLQGITQRQYIDHLFLKKKKQTKKEVFIIQSEEQTLFSIWTDHVEK